MWGGIIITSLKEAAIAYWRLQKWVASIEAERKIAAESSLRALKDFLKENDVEVIDLTGKQYDPGLSVEVLLFEDKDTACNNIPIIIEMIQPIIIQNGSVIEFGKVIIAKKPQTITPISNIESITSEIENNEHMEITDLTLDAKKKFKVSYLLLCISTIIFCLSVFAFLIYQNIRINNKVSSIITTQSKMEADFNQYNKEINKIIDDENQVNTLIENNNSNNEKVIVNWQVYVVKSGDTLFSVCSEYNVNYFSWQQVILNTNGINDENEIYVGQALLLPVMMKGE